ncbi:MAG: Crp/Fnr family transcriptional regulator, partial [Methylococcales bacterium]|nr:Crp/Fnr family transcriptional regulator [Methylococcales bacterium]
MDTLRKNLLFSGLDEQQFQRVLSCSKKIELKEGDVLFESQQPADYFYLLGKGDIKLYRLSIDGTEKIIELIKTGQTFAEAMMFMEGSIYPVSAQALTDCCLIQIEMVMFRALLKDSPQVSLKILGHMSQRLHGLIQEIDQLTLQNAKMRVVQFLLRELPSDAVSPHSLQWNMPKNVLASRLSVRPETFSRILQQLAQEKFIKVDGKSIDILDIDGLNNH